MDIKNRINFGLFEDRIDKSKNIKKYNIKKTKLFMEIKQNVNGEIKNFDIESEANWINFYIEAKNEDDFLNVATEQLIWFYNNAFYNMNGSIDCEDFGVINKNIIVKNSIKVKIIDYEMDME